MTSIVIEVQDDIKPDYEGEFILQIIGIIAKGEYNSAWMTDEKVLPESSFPQAE